MTVARSIFHREQVKRIVSETYSFEDIRCSSAVVGVNDCYYVSADKEYVLKVYQHNRRTEGDIKQEIQILVHLSYLGIYTTLPCLTRLALQLLFRADMGALG